MKRKVAIVTDSTAQLPLDLVTEYGIAIIPLNVNWSGQTLLDGIDIQPDAFYQRLKTASDLPTTSQPSVGQFIELFTAVSQTADSIVGIFISDALSGTMDSARAAVKELPDLTIEIVDSRSTAMGMGLMVIEAARMAAGGKSSAEIAAAIRQLVPKVRLIFVVDTLEFLHRGGRIGGAQRLLGSVLSIKPLLHLEDGKIEALASVRTKRKAVDHLLNILREDAGSSSQMHCGVLHAAAPDEAKALAEQVQQDVHPVELLLTEISPVIGTHTGPGAVGIAYFDGASIG